MRKRGGIYIYFARDGVEKGRKNDYWTAMAIQEKMIF